MSTTWSSAFKEIYGNTPTKSDYSLAPAHVKAEFYATCPKSPASSAKQEKSAKRKIGVSIKRSADDEWSPVKRPSAKRPPPPPKGEKEEPESSSSSDFTSKFEGQRSVLRRSPRKQIKVSSPLKRALRPVQSIEPKSPSRLQAFRSPQKGMKNITASSPSVFRSLFDTPEKGEPSIFASTTTLMGPPTNFPNSPTTPIRSPRKPVRKTECSIKNPSVLLLPTPEKKPKVEVELEPFANEEVASSSKTTKKIPAGGEAKAFDPTTGKIVKRAFKRPSTEPRVSKKKPKENFVRINMMKKSYVRGKVSAEQKRKMLRKMKWKKRTGGGAR